MRRAGSFENTLMLGKIEGRRRRGRLSGHGFGWTPGAGDGQGGLECCGSWGHKELDTTDWLNWTELKWSSMQHQVHKESLGTTASCDSMSWSWVWFISLRLIQTSGCNGKYWKWRVPFMASWLCSSCSRHEGALERHSWSSWGTSYREADSARRLGHGAGEQHHALNDGPRDTQNQVAARSPGVLHDSRRRETTSSSPHSVWSEGNDPV